jgi:hypothetical protein
MPDVSYVPGALIAVAGDRCLAVVEAAPDSAPTAWIWQRVTEGASAGALLAGLLGDGFEGVGGFALLDGLAAKQRRLFCRGAVAATVEGGNVSARIDGVGLLTWREYVVAADAERIVLGEPPDDTLLRLPTAAAVLLARCVIVDLTSAASRDTLRYDSPVAGYSAGAYASGRSDAFAPPLGLPKGRRVAALREAAAPPEAAAIPDVIATVRLIAPPEIADTGRQSVPDNLPRPASPPPGPRSPGPPAGLIDAVEWGPGPVPAAELPAHGSPMPSATRAPLPAAAAVTGPDEFTVKDDEFTVKRAELPDPADAELPDPAEAEQAALATTRADWIGPLLPALICPAGHVNPPSEADCRKCGATLPNDAVVAPRPALGVLRLSTGDVVTLDRGVVMGRHPRVGFAGAGGEERPHVVSLPSAGGDISRTHLRVTLDGWHVLVTDLDSTNGTLVALPGRDPEQLRPGEPVPIRPGTVVTLADGIDFRYEADE